MVDSLRSTPFFILRNRVPILFRQGVAMLFRDFGFFWDSDISAPRAESWLALVSHGHSISLAFDWFRTGHVMWFWLVKCEVKSTEWLLGRLTLFPVKDSEKYFVVCGCDVWCSCSHFAVMRRCS